MKKIKDLESNVKNTCSNGEEKDEDPKIWLCIQWQNLKPNSQDHLMSL